MYVFCHSPTSGRRPSFMSKPMSLLQPSLPGEDVGHPFHSSSSSPSSPFGFALNGSQHQTLSSPLPMAVLADLSLFHLLQHAVFFTYSHLVSDPLFGSSLRPFRSQHSSPEPHLKGIDHGFFLFSKGPSLARVECYSPHQCFGESHFKRSAQLL